MNKYAVRLTMSHSNEGIVNEFVNSCSSQWMYCLEGAGGVDKREHFHMYVETNDKHQAFSKKLKRYFPALRGNRDFSVKNMTNKVDAEHLKYRAYIVKDGNFQTAGYTEEQVAEYVKYDLTVKMDIKKTRRTVLQKIEEDYLVDAIVAAQAHMDTQVIKTRINYPKIVFSAVVSYFKETNTLVREFLIKSYAQTLLLKYDDNYANELAERMATYL